MGAGSQAHGVCGISHDENQKSKLPLCPPDPETAIPVKNRGIEGAVRKMKRNLRFHYIFA